MAEFQDFDIEVQDERGSEVESDVVTVTTAGVPQTFTPASTRIIQKAFINVPRVGPNSGTNSISRYILYSVDGGTTYHTLMVNESIAIPGNFTDLRIDSSHNGMKAEIEVRT